MTPASTGADGSWIDAITPRWLSTVLRAAAVTQAAVLDIEIRSLEVASAAGLNRPRWTGRPASGRGPGGVTVLPPSSGPWSPGR